MKIKFLTKYKEEKEKFNTLYTKDENTEAISTGLIATIIIAVPIILVVFNLFYCFMMYPYFVFYLSGFGLILLIYLYFIFKNACLKKIKKYDELNYNVLLYTRFIFYAVIAAIIVVILSLIIVPICFN